MNEARTRRMYRYTIAVDDQDHEIPLAGDPVAVTAPDDRTVEFWAEHTSGGAEILRVFRVFGTGHQLPRTASWVGTCPRTPAGLVWHLYEIDPATLRRKP